MSGTPSGRNGQGLVRVANATYGNHSDGSMQRQLGYWAMAALLAIVLPGCKGKSHGPGARRVGATGGDHDSRTRHGHAAFRSGGGGRFRFWTRQPLIPRAVTMASFTPFGSAFPGRTVSSMLWPSRLW
jgi:hypothetical protein